jgi:hypothetical protein
MHIQPHFEKLLRLLEENRAEYLVVGGYAVAFHGYPRYTKDIDIFYANSPQNIAAIRKTLVQFGFSKKDFNVKTFSTPGNIITFGVEPVRVDLINEIAGVEFKDAWAGKVRGTYGSAIVNFIGRQELIKNKLATPREQDKVDAKKIS